MIALDNARPLHLVAPASDEPEVLPYKPGESAAEIAYRLRNGIRRRPAFVSEARRG